MVSPAYVSKSQKSAVCGLELAEPVCPFCQMAAAVDTTTAAVWCCSHSLLHIFTCTVFAAVLSYAVLQDSYFALYGVVAFSSPMEEFCLFFFSIANIR